MRPARWPGAGAGRARQLVVATADPGRPAGDKATWDLVTSLPRPGGPREADSPWPTAGLAEIVRIYGIRNWIEQSSKQVKEELGWVDFQVRSDTAIRRHQALVNCAFSFCWLASKPPPGPAPDSVQGGGTAPQPRQAQEHRITPPAPSWPQRPRAVRS